MWSEKRNAYCEPLEKVGVMVRLHFSEPETLSASSGYAGLAATVSYLLSSLRSCAKLTSLDQTHDAAGGLFIQNDARNLRWE